MPHTSFWLLRHALVERNARAMLYGTLDVPLCPETLLAQTDAYRSLATHLPRPAHWAVTPLSRTVDTAKAIFAAGYPAVPLHVEPALAEQDLGAWQGLAHDALPAKLAAPAHPFWPLAGDETPPDGESLETVKSRVGPALERLAAAHRGGAVIVVSHGGAIRAGIAHALAIPTSAALHFAIQNISVTRLERHDGGWRVVGVNAVAGPGGAYALAA